MKHNTSTTTAAAFSPVFPAAFPHAGRAPAARPETLLTLADLEARWGVSNVTLRRLLRGGGVPHLLVGRRVRFRLEDIRACEARAVSAAPERDVADLARELAPTTERAEAARARARTNAAAAGNGNGRA